MSDAAISAARLIDELERNLEPDEEIGAIMLIAEVVADDEEQTAHMRWHCSDSRYVVQRGMIAWAHSGMARHDVRVISDDEDDDG